MARQYFLESQPSQEKRTKFIARRESYHGTTLGALSVGGHVARRAMFEPLLLRNISRVSPCNAYRGVRDGETVEQYVARLAAELDEEFQRLGPETVCAFVAEPVVGAALGCVPPVPGYFAAMRAVCDRHGALLILDEVMSGMGRTGTMHAWQSPLIGVVPDIQTIGKGLGGGYAPVAGMLVSHKVVDAMQKGSGSFGHGQTYQGHPIACRAALEVVRTIKEEKLVEKVQAAGRLLGDLLRKRVAVLPHVGDVRGKGLFWAVSRTLTSIEMFLSQILQIEFVRDKDTKEPFEPSEGIAMGIHGKGVSEHLEMLLKTALTTSRNAIAIQYLSISRHRNSRWQKRRSCPPRPGLQRYASGCGDDRRAHCSSDPRLL